MEVNEQIDSGSNPTATPAACVVCKSVDKLKRCCRCRSVLYCSREHQREDWIRHKTECRRQTLSVQGQNLGTVIQSSETNTVSGNQNISRSIPSIRGNLEQHIVDDTQKEIETILDFSTVLPPTNMVPQTSEEKKEIFFELVKSDSNYAGPSEDVNASYNNITNTLCPDESIMNNNREEAIETERIQQQEVQLFNTHPFRRLKFPKPEQYELPDLAYFVSLRLTQLGYCILDDALEESLIEGIISEVNAIHQRNELSRGDTLQGASSVGYRNDMIKWLDGQSEDMKYVSQGLAFMDSLVDLLQSHLNEHCHIQGRTEAMLACYPEDGSYFRRHIDNEFKDGRRITCTLYLNKDWNIERDGGLMRMFPPKQDKPVDVPPLANRLLFFWSDGRTPHEIHPAHRNRYSITVWYYDKDEKEASNVEKLKRETEEIYNRISVLEEERKRLQEMTSTQHIRNQAMEAVQALTSGELQALSILIDHHPDPKAALTAMGISEAIQDALIVHLSSQDTGPS